MIIANEEYSTVTVFAGTGTAGKSEEGQDSAKLRNHECTPNGYHPYPLNQPKITLQRIRKQSNA
jgi:hypothetical protein